MAHFAVLCLGTTLADHWVCEGHPPFPEVGHSQRITVQMKGKRYSEDAQLHNCPVHSIDEKDFVSLAAHTHMAVERNWMWKGQLLYKQMCPESL